MCRFVPALIFLSTAGPSWQSIVDPSASDLVGTSSKITVDRCAVIFQVPHSKRKIIAGSPPCSSQSSTFPFGPWEKVRTTMVHIATAIYATLLYARGVLYKPPTRRVVYGTGRASKTPKMSRGRPHEAIQYADGRQPAIQSSTLP